MTPITFRLPTGVLVWQARCEDCQGAFGVLAAEPPEGVFPKFCPFCARRVQARLAYHKEVPA